MNSIGFIFNFLEERGKLSAGEHESFRTANYIDADLVDSIEFVVLISDLENNYGIEYSETDIQSPEFKTIEGLARITDGLVAAKTPH